MAKTHVKRYIYSRKRSTDSVAEQVEIAHAMWDAGIEPNHDGLKLKEIEDTLDLELEYNVDTSVKTHLTEIDLVEEFLPPGNDTLVIAEWRDEGEGVVNGNVDEAVDEGIENLIDHIEEDDPASDEDTPAVADGGRVTLRQVVADRFDIRIPETVEEFLRDGDRLEKLNAAVEAIEENDEMSKRDDYGEISIINMPYRYRLTEWAVEQYER